jgi:uncharacterized protein (TIGR02246 family)
MRALRLATLLCCVSILCPGAFAQDARAASKDEAAIRQVLTDQQSAWNNGDIDTFMRGYKNSPDTTFIGKSIAYGYQPILERYKKAYGTREAMGKLDFSDVTVKMLGRNYAVVTGRFHLARAEAVGGDASGIYSLIFERQGERETDRWRIILDHSSSN